jgi:DNA-3-methyladenine glycosylase II
LAILIIQKIEEGFAYICHIILEQHVSIESVKACYVKLENYFKKITPENIYYSFDDELKSCGLSRQKIVYLKDLASKVLNNEINFESFHPKPNSK